MKIRIRTAYKQIVFELLREENMLLGAVVKEDRQEIELLYENEDYKFELRGWCAAAIGCGLVHGMEIM